jgi:hypothetical protein
MGRSKNVYSIFVGKHIGKQHRKPGKKWDDENGS